MVKLGDLLMLGHELGKFAGVIWVFFSGFFSANRERDRMGERFLGSTRMVVRTG